MKYNRSLDLLCAAAEYHRAGKVNSAAKAFTAACADPSILAALAIVEANNSVAHAKMVRAAKMQAQKSRTVATKTAQRAGLETAGDPACDAGEEFRVEPDENGDRVVQEADFDEMVGDEDFEDDTLSASADEDEDDEDEDGEGEEEDAKASAKPTKAAAAPAKAGTVRRQPTTAAASFARALKNFDALSKR